MHNPIRPITGPRRILQGFRWMPWRWTCFPGLTGWLRALGDMLLLDCSTLAIDPAPGNQRAIAAYRKAGFAGDDHRLDAQGRPVRVMTRLR